MSTLISMAAPTIKAAKTRLFHQQQGYVFVPLQMFRLKHDHWFGVFKVLAKKSCLRSVLGVILATLL